MSSCHGQDPLKDLRHSGTPGAPRSHQDPPPPIPLSITPNTSKRLKPKRPFKPKGTRCRLRWSPPVASFALSRDLADSAEESVLSLVDESSLPEEERPAEENEVQGPAQGTRPAPELAPLLAPVWCFVPPRVFPSQTAAKKGRFFKKS